MRTLLARTAIVTVGLLVSAPGLDAQVELALRVSPGVTTAPGHVVVTATVEHHADNRVLEIAAESAHFFRSSQFPLEGDRAPRITQFELKNLPGGDYAVVVILHRANHGRTITVQRSVLVTSAIGER